MNKNVWWFSLQEVKKYFRVMISPISLITNLCLILFFVFFRKQDFYLSFKDNLPFYFMIAFFFISVLNIVYFWMIRRERYFFIERNSIVLMILYWINLLMLRPFDIDNRLSDILVIGFLCLCITYVFYTNHQVKLFLQLKIINDKK